MWILTILLATTAPPPPQLEKLAATLRSSPAWRASFVQTYTPAGFAEGTTETGTLLLAPPNRLRFEYRGDGARVFAVDGNVARNLDQQAGTCDAVRLDEATWGRLPLAVLLDPAAAVAGFETRLEGDLLRLVPRQVNPDIATIEVAFSKLFLAERVTVTDPSGNRNAFSFTSWSPVGAPDDGMFRPALPGQPPCRPEGP